MAVDKRRGKRRWAAATAAAAVLLAPVAAAALPPVWTARDADSTIIIFGSVHVLPAGLDWMPPDLRRALARADDLWFEVPLDDAATVAAQRESSARGFLKGRRPLSSYLSADGRARLPRVCEALGLPLEAVERMRPWYAELTLSSALYRQAGADVARGVERTVADAAPPGVRTEAFESPGEQVAFFAAAPLVDQLASFEDTLRQIDEAPGDYQQLVRAWMAGDLHALNREAVAPLRTSAPRLYASLVARRNARWADRIIDRLHGSGRTVVVVGVGHLVGSDGLPALLRARGVTVDGPD